MMSNLLRRGVRALVRLVALVLFLGALGAVVSALAGWTPGFADTTSMRDVTDFLSIEEEVYAFAPPSAVPTDEGPLQLDAIETGRGIHNLGDDPVLDEWWRHCEEGSGFACDRLFAEAPLGSAYEDFGLTCGNRPDVLHCQRELDGRLDEPVIDGWPLPFTIDSP